MFTLRGIQIIGLLIALAAYVFIIYAHRKGRLNSRFFLFWTLFWGIFTVFDLYPSLASYFVLWMDFGPNMYVLTAGAVLTLFVLVFFLFSFLLDLNHKVTVLIREQAILYGKVARLLAVTEKDNLEKENSNSDSSS